MRRPGCAPTRMEQRRGGYGFLRGPRGPPRPGAPRGGRRPVGEQVAVAELAFDGADRARFRARLAACQRVLERMLAEDRFEKGRKLAGVELELVLIDGLGHPAMVNEKVLRQIASADFQTELGAFNLEVNIAPHKLVGTVLSELAEELRTALLYADRVAAGCGARVAAIGILPTLDA